MSSAAVLRSPAEAANLTSDHPDITEAADFTYDAIVRQYRGMILAEHVHRLQICRQASTLMGGRLEEMGYSVIEFALQIAEEQQDQPGWTHFIKHHNLRVDSSRGRLTIDPAWQQFLPPELQADGLPRVLVGTGDEAVDQVRAAGMEDKFLDFWRERVPEL